MINFNYLKILILSILSFAAFGYANFIGYSYQQCITCHYNPYGNGPLNDYGRALGATLVSSKEILKDSLSDEDRAEMSSFLYGKYKGDYFKPHANYRGLYYKTDIGSETSQAEWINMMANVGFTFRPTKNDSLIVVASIGYAPEPSNPVTGEEPSTYRSREHYIGWRPSKNHGLYFGMMDKVFGIRIPDHNSFSRTVTNLTMNDGAHAALYHYTNKSFDFGLQYFLGNLQQDENVRPSGFTTQFEYSLNNLNRVGASFLSQSNTFSSQSMWALHWRAGILKGSSIMVEFGRVTKEFEGSEATTSEYFFLQNHILIKRGLFALVTFEQFKDNIEDTDKTLKLGPGIQYFPFQGIEARFDIYNLRSLSEQNYSNDTWSFAGQVHIWL